jgi:hypothetical protein
MYNLDTEQEVEWNVFMNILDNNELQVVSRKWTEEEWAQLRKDIEEHRPIYQKNIKVEHVLV